MGEGEGASGWRRGSWVRSRRTSPFFRVQNFPASQSSLPPLAAAMMVSVPLPGPSQLPAFSCAWCLPGRGLQRPPSIYPLPGVRLDSSSGLWSWLGCLCSSGLATTPQQGQYKPGIREPRDPAPPRSPPAPPLSAVLLQIQRPCAEPPGQVCLPHQLSVCRGLCPGRQTPPGSPRAAHTARHGCQHAPIHEYPRARCRRAGPAHGAEIPASHSDPHRSQRARPSRRAEEGVDGQESLLRRPHWADNAPLSPPGHTHGAHAGTSTPLGGNLADRHGNTPTLRPPGGSHACTSSASGAGDVNWVPSHWADASARLSPVFFPLFWVT